MKMKFSINGKSVTRKHVKELIGEERLARYVADAKETMREDPLIENDFWLGAGIGMLTIQLDPWN